MATIKRRSDRGGQWQVRYRDPEGKQRGRLFDRKGDAERFLATTTGGCSVKVVQKALGHASAKVTLDTYGHIWPDSEDLTRRAIDAALGAQPVADRIAATGEEL